jgi:hypothetical protein
MEAVSGTRGHGIRSLITIDVWRSFVTNLANISARIMFFYRNELCLMMRKKKYPRKTLVPIQHPRKQRLVVQLICWEIQWRSWNVNVAVRISWLLLYFTHNVTVILVYKEHSNFLTHIRGWWMFRVNACKSMAEIPKEGNPSHGY